MWRHAFVSSGLALATFGLSAWVPSRGAADPPAPELEAARPADEADVQGELKAARKELLALVARDASAPRDDARSEGATPALVMGSPPASLTSAVPPQRKATPALQRMRLDWLEGLSLPDLPVRWDDRLVRMLEHYRSDARAEQEMRGLLARAAVPGQDQASCARRSSEDSPTSRWRSAYDPTARSEVGASGCGS